MPSFFVFLVLAATVRGPVPAITPEALFAQNENTQPKSDAETFFSGNVVEMSTDRVTVARSVLGKAAEKRTFIVTPATRIEGKMRQKSRVTVRYAASEQGEVALSILVRERADKNDKGEKKK